MLRWTVVSLLAASGCISTDSVDCGNGVVCAHGKQCATVGGQALCVEPSQVGCTTGELCDNGNGSCYDGVCLPNECGNGRQDLNEVCDDSNTDGGDGCSALCDSAETCGNDIIDAVKGEQCDQGIAGLSGDGCTSVCTVEALAWTDVSPGSISKRAGHSLVYDENRLVVVAFGGYDESKLLGDTWEWDGLRWTKRLLGRSPPARAFHAMAWNGQHAMVFGGGNSALLNDTWELVGDTWVQRQPAVAPQPRMFAAMAYDRLHDKVVLFGGVDFVQGTFYVDTWLWDETTGTWAMQTTPAHPPDGSGDGVMAYDEIRKRVTWFGGPQRETWVWSGSSWSKLSPGNLPSHTNYDLMVNDTASQVLVMFGQDSLNETWLFDGSDWTKATTTPGVGTRDSMGAAYDVATGLIVLLGGNEYIAPSTNLYGDTYEWDFLNGWTQPTPSNAFPAARGGHALAYDAEQGVGVLFGGAADLRTSTFDDTWIWRDGSWLLLSPTTSPNARADHGMVYDSDRDRIVMFGGADQDLNAQLPSFASYGDTWELDVRTSQWVNKTSGSSPSARRHPAMAYDAGAKRVVLFGGATYTSGPLDYFGDTWTWDGTSWTHVVPAVSPPAREGAAMAYDPIRQRVVMFGGSAGVFAPLFGDMWEWDGANWTQISATPMPEARWLSSMNYDPYRQRIVLAFGRGAAGFFDDVWEWDGAAWTRLFDHAGTGPHSAAFYDDIGNQLVTFGGFGYASAVDKTLAMQYGTPTAPRETCIVPGADDDHDGLVGGADPDCWARTQPLCPPGTTCPPTAPRCGDGACGPVENHAVCPGDCP